MIQEQALNDVGAAPAPDPWSGWARVVDLPASFEHDLDDSDEAPDTPAASTPAGRAEPQPAPGSLESAVAQLAEELADERRVRTHAEEARRDAEARVHAAEVEAARLSAEVTAQRTRISELERDRDEVIHRAEELLTAVRERSDQRLAALEVERAALATRVQDAWLAAAVLRRARPLRLRPSQPATQAEAEEEVLDALDEYEPEPALAAESPHLASEIEELRQRLRAQRHTPPNIVTVEDGVEDLREARLARADAKRRRRK
jgi:phage baseplate assembly protein W